MVSSGYSLQVELTGAVSEADVESEGNGQPEGESCQALIRERGGKSKLGAGRNHKVCSVQVNVGLLIRHPSRIVE